MMLDLAFLVLVAGWSALLGSRVLSWCAVAVDHPLDRLGLSLPLGLGTLALVMLGLGELGWLTPGAIVAALVVGLVLAVPRGLRSPAWRASIARHDPHVDRDFPHGEDGESGTAIMLDWAFGGALAACLAGSLLTALAPVTDGDALCYHLQVPKVFLASGAVGFDPDLHETVYPLVTEMLYAIALALRGPEACRLVHWLLGVAFALNVAALARPFLKARAWWAGTIALLVPAVSNGMSAPLNDVALAAFGTAALFAWSLWADRPKLGTAMLAGMLAGSALGVKYPAIVWVGLLGAAMLGVRPRSAKHALGFAVAALLVGGGWYLRAYLHTGNPVHPFFRHAFGGAGLDEVLDPHKRPLAVSLWNILTALIPMTLDPDRFDSFSHQFGPMFLLFLPGLVLFRAPRRVIGLTALGFTFLAVCLTQRQSMRFVLLVLGPLSIAVAWSVLMCARRGGLSRACLVALVVLVIAFEAAIALGHARHGARVVLGRESRGSFLERWEPTYRVGQWVDAHLPSTARLIGQDHRGFYLPRPYTMELAHRRRTGLGGRGETAEAIVGAIRERGFTHLLMCPPIPETAIEFDPALGRLLGPWLAEREPVYRADLTDGDGVTRRYAIYALDQPSSTLAQSERATR